MDEAEAEAALRKMAVEVGDPLGGVLRSLLGMLDRERRRAEGAEAALSLQTEKVIRMQHEKRMDPKNVDAAVMARLCAPFGCEFIPSATFADNKRGRWRIHDANDDAIASVSGLEEGYAKLIVRALNEHFERKAKRR